MKKLLINIDYRDNSGKFWFESYCKNQTVTFDEEKQTIHELIKGICEEEGMELTYKGKPKANIFVDVDGNKSKKVGYLYRGKSEIHDRSMNKPQMGYFDVWVSIRSICDFEIESIEEY